MDPRLRDPGIEKRTSESPPPLRRNRDFLLLWTGQVASTIGTRASSVAFPLLVLAMTGSPSKAGLVAFAQTLPFPLLFRAAGRGRPLTHTVRNVPPVDELSAQIRP